MEVSEQGDSVCVSGHIEYQVRHSVLDQSIHVSQAGKDPGRDLCVRWGKGEKDLGIICHGFGGCRHVFYFEAYGFQLVDSASADWRRALQAS